MVTVANVAQRYSLWLLPMEYIREGDNQRVDYDDEDIDGIALSMSAAPKDKKGLQIPDMPLMGIWHADEGQFELTDGHRRFRAAKRAVEVYGAIIPAMPCQLERNVDPTTTYYRQLKFGKSLTPLEQARVIEKLLALGEQTSEIVRKTRLNKGAVSGLIGLLNAPSGVMDMVENGETSVSVAVKAARAARQNEDGPDAVELLAAASKVAAQAGSDVVRQPHLDAVVNQRVEQQWETVSPAPVSNGEASQTPSMFDIRAAEPAAEPKKVSNGKPKVVVHESPSGNGAFYAYIQKEPGVIPAAKFVGHGDSPKDALWNWFEAIHDPEKKLDFEFIYTQDEADD